jgi:protease-4
MADTESQPSPQRASAGGGRQDVVDRLVFAALREQTRARRWRIFFMLFFIAYLTVVTVILLTGDSGAYVAGGSPDGERHTAVVRVDGVIAAGEKAGSEAVIEGLTAAFEHEDTAGIVIEINSPGGSPVQASYIFDEILRLRQEHASIPVYAVIEDIAASGGYFVAAAADSIYVNQSSLVGSIGVRMDSFGFVGMMEKLGIERRLLIAGENKALLDPFLPEESAQKAHLQGMLDEVHRHFIDAVKKGRGERLREEEDLFSGLIWSGERAIELGLVDALGNTRAVARELEAEDIVDFTPRTDLLQRIAERIGSSAGRQLRQALRDGLELN